MACAATPSATVPEGGKGQSSRCSRVYYLPPECDDLKLDGTCPSGTPSWFSEQVTRIEVNTEVFERKYGHDKSFCAQDVTPGIISWNGSLTTKIQCVDQAFSFHAGQILWLQVWPLGIGHAAVIEGYAMIGRDGVVCNLENGEPVEHNYSYSSKGLWHIPDGIAGTFDCCNCCEGLDGGSEGEFGSGMAVPNADGVVIPQLTRDPVTVYQWTGSAWEMNYDECSEGFVSGDAPHAPGAFVGQMRFVPCVVG